MVGHRLASITSPASIFDRAFTLFSDVTAFFDYAPMIHNRSKVNDATSINDCTCVDDSVWKDYTSLSYFRFWAYIGCGMY